MLDTHNNTIKNYDYSHEIKDAKNRKKIIYLSRNPLDVAVSRYFQDKYRHNVKAPFFEYVQKKLYEVIDYRLSIEKLETDHWHFVTYEELKGNPKTLNQIFKYININLDIEYTNKIWEDCSFENMKSFQNNEKYQHKKYNLIPQKHKNEPEAYKVRKGKIKGYTDYLTPEEIKIIRETAQEKYRDIYEITF